MAEKSETSMSPVDVKVYGAGSILDVANPGGTTVGTVSTIPAGNNQNGVVVMPIPVGGLQPQPAGASVIVVTVPAKSEDKKVETSAVFKRL